MMLLQAAGQEIDIGEIVLHHTADAYAIDFYPIGRVAWHRWPDLHLGSFTVNLTPTKHVVFLVIAAALVFLTIKLAGWALARFVFDGSFTLPVGPFAGLGAAVVLLTVTVGLANSREVLRRPPLEVLRAE